MDALASQAVAAGAKVVMPVQDQFWGDRYGKLVDPFGHLWDIATHKEDVAPEEIPKRAAAVFGRSCRSSRSPAPVPKGTVSTLRRYLHLRVPGALLLTGIYNWGWDYAEVGGHSIQERTCRWWWRSS